MNIAPFVIEAAVLALLAQAPAIASGDALVDWQATEAESLPEQMTHRVHVFAEQSTNQRAQLTEQPDDWTTSISVQIITRTDPAKQAKQRLDELARDVYARIQTDPGLSGKCMDGKCTGISFDRAFLDAEIFSCRLLWEFQARQPYNSMEMA